MTAYQSIGVDEDEESANLRGSEQNYKRNQICIISLLFIALLIASPLLAFFGQNDGDGKEKALTAKIQHRHINVPMPAGVNLGSWVR